MTTIKYNNVQIPDIASLLNENSNILMHDLNLIYRFKTEHMKHNSTNKYKIN